MTCSPVLICQAYTAIQSLNVASHFSLRDITFHASTEGVRIVALTDVPCHLFCRLSSKHPWIHKKPSLRRGVQFAEDVRFCFTVYEDNEQSEAGDTLEHTWWKTDWSPCVTKWLYLWGFRSGEICVSTSPFFEHHNTGEAPVPPPEAMYQLNAIEEQTYVLATAGSWQLLDLSYACPPDSTGVVVEVHQSDTGFPNRIALRKPLASYSNYFPAHWDSVTWAIIGLDDQRRLEYFVQTGGVFTLKVVGYTGRDVVFLDTPIEILPTVNSVWQDFDVGSQLAGAELILCDLGDNVQGGTRYGIRPQGSPWDNHMGAYRKWPFCVVPFSGIVQTWYFNRNATGAAITVYGYIAKDVTRVTTPIVIPLPFLNTYNTVDLGAINPAIRWAFLELYVGYSTPLFGLRKHLTTRDDKAANSAHNWAIVHTDHDHRADAYKGHAAFDLRQWAETH